MKYLNTWVDRFSVWVVKRAVRFGGADFGASVRGEGYIIRHATGERVPFTMWGEPSEELLAQAASLVARTLYGPLAGGPFSRMRGAVTHATAVRQALGDLVVDALDPSGPGNLVFRTSGDAEVATLPFSATAFGATDGSGVATANAITSDTTATGGTIAKWTAETGAAVMKFTGAAGTSGSDINLSSLSVAANDTVAVSSLTYTAPP